MPEYDRIDSSETTDVNKTNASKECDICHYWYFKDIDLMQKSMCYNDVAIVYFKGRAYRVDLWYMSKDDVIIIMKNSSVVDKKCVL